MVRQILQRRCLSVPFVAGSGTVEDGGRRGKKKIILYFDAPLSQNCESGAYVHVCVRERVREYEPCINPARERGRKVLSQRHNGRFAYFTRHSV